MKVSRISRTSLQIAKDVEDAGRPLMELVDRNIDIEGFFGKDHIHDHKISGLGDYHVFNIQKDSASGDVRCYRKFVSNAEAIYTDIPHVYQVDNGQYRDFIVTYRADAPDITHDPHSLPLHRVDTSSMRALVKALINENFFPVTNGSISESVKSLIDIFDRFDSQPEKLKQSCSHCYDIVSAIDAIGVIKRAKDQNSVEQTKEQTEKTKRRADLKVRLSDHLSDPTHRRSHESTVVIGWWTQWINGRVQQIQAIYDGRRPYSLAASRPSSGYLAHPDDKTAAERELVDRVEIQHAEKHGQPKIGDIGVFRSSREEGKPEFWVAEIIDFTNQSREQADDERLRVERGEKVLQYRKECEALGKKPDPKLCGLFPTTNYLPVAPTATEITATQNYNQQFKDRKSHRGKDRLSQLGQRESEDTFRFSHVRIKPWMHNEPSKPTNRSKVSSRSAPIAPPLLSTTPSTSSTSDGHQSLPMEIDASSADDPTAAASSSSSIAAVPRHLGNSADEDSFNVSAVNIDRWKQLTYRLPDTANKWDMAASSHWFLTSTLIVWASKSEMLDSRCKIKAGMWNKIAKDMKQSAQS